MWFVITGAHVIVYSSDAEADRAFFQDVLQYPSVDAGGGWLIFKLPPAEVAVHPAEGAGTHELYLMCDDVNATVDDLKAKGVTCGPVSDEGWGLLTSIRLPGGGDLGLYEPRHPKATELQAYSFYSGRSRDSRKVSSDSHCSTALAYGGVGLRTFSGLSTYDTILPSG